MPDSSKRTIMVVDDDRAIRESITIFLHAHGYEASSATDGYDALWQLTLGLVDIIVSDLEMPGLSGCEFLSVIRKRYPRMLVVAMSERPGGESVLGSASADAFYPKVQQHPKKLLSTIAALLRKAAVQGSTQKLVPSEGTVTGHRSDIAEASHVLVTCPECLKSFSIVAPNGTDWREARGALAAPSNATVPATPASGTEYSNERVPGKLCDSTRKIASLVQRGSRYLWYGLAGGRFRGGPSAGPSIAKPREQVGAKQLRDANQTSPALHGEDREQ